MEQIAHAYRGRETDRRCQILFSEPGRSSVPLAVRRSSDLSSSGGGRLERGARRQQGADLSGVWRHHAGR